MSVHIVPVRVYVFIFVALLFLTGITASVAYLDLGALNAVIALTIAVTKAVLVALYFMHVKYSPQLTKLVITAGVIWLAILLAITLSDYLTRDWLQIAGS